MDKTSVIDDPDEATRVADIEANMTAQGVATTAPAPVDYFGFDQRERVTLPDGVSWIEFKVFTEGDRRKFLNATTKDVRFQKVTQDAIMKMLPGEERYQLLKTGIVDWNLTRQGKPISFTPQNLEQFLTSGPPRVIDLIEKEIRKSNAWMLADLSIEDIQTQINELTEMLEARKLEEEGKAFSSTK